MIGGVDVSVNVSGGGGSGQAGAIRHGLSRALEKMDSEFESLLKKEGHMRRDPRKIERKENRTTWGKKKIPIFKTLNSFTHSLSQPLGTPTEGFVFLLAQTILLY